MGSRLVGLLGLEQMHEEPPRSVSTAIGQVKRGLQRDAELCERLADVQRCLGACYSNT